VSAHRPLCYGAAPAIRIGFGGLTHYGMGAIRLDGVDVLFTVGLAILTALLIGLLPALRTTRPDLTRGLKAGGGENGKRRGWGALGLRDGLVVGEIALAVVLLAGAGLMLRSLAQLLAVDVGIDPKGVTTLRLALPPGMPSRDSSAASYATILQRIAGVPGVESVALGNCPPVSGACTGSVIWFRDRPAVPKGTEPPIGVQFVTPDWLRTLGAQLVRGRFFTAADRLGAPKVVVINEAAARKYWPNEDPVGKPVGIGMSGFDDRAEVIGIIKDVPFANADDPEVPPDAYVSYLQAPRGSAILFVRSPVPGNAIVPSVRAALREMNPAMPIYDVRSLEERVRLATIRQRFTGGVLTAFAAAALAIAGIGIYALIAWEIGRRTREIGIRMALGAEARSILALVAHRGAILLALGLGVGLGLSLGLTRLMQAMLFGVEPTDPVTYVSLGLLLIVTGTAATLIPARRATRVNPVEAIRSE
jgi:putative ABC transport system permease protein